MIEANKAWANIAAVERETGLGKDTLRVWERRYGFPQPERDSNGDRLYPTEQVMRLRLIKRLMDRGMRPGRLVAAEDSVLETLAAEIAASSSSSDENSFVPGREAEAGALHGDDAEIAAVFHLLREHDAMGLRRALSHILTRDGLRRFVVDIAPRMNQMVGEGWASGQIQVFEEHLYTEQLQGVLRQAIIGLPQGGRGPRFLLTTVPEEQHMLGILLLEALLTLHGIRCVSLGTQTPISDIVSAASAHASDVVALSFSAAFPARQIPPLVKQLRWLLPRSVGLWVGGGGIDKSVESRLRKVGEEFVLGGAAGKKKRKADSAAAGVVVCPSLESVLERAIQLGGDASGQ